MPKKELIAGFVVLSWNGADLLKTCFKSLEKQTVQSFSVCLVDNGSVDDTCKVFEKAKLPHKLLIKNSVNRGFAPAANQGITELLKTPVDYIVLLNNDVVLSNDWLATMLAAMEKADPKLGFAQGSNFTDSSRLQYDSTGIYLEEGFIPRQKTSDDETPRAIGPNGAALIMRRQFVEDMLYKGELLDSTFFAYVEDVDLILRAYLKGWDFGFFKEASAIHLGSATGERVSTKKMYWGARNMIWLLAKDVPMKVLIKKGKKILISHLADMEYLFKTNRRLFWAYFRGTMIGAIMSPLYFRKRREIFKCRQRSDQEILMMLAPSNPPLTNPVKYIFRKLSLS